MNYYGIENLKKDDLIQIACDLDIRFAGKTKKVLVKEIIKEKDNRYIRINQIGNTGKDAKTYLIKLNNKKLALKQFKKRKSSNRILEEAELQILAAQSKISPKVIDIDVTNKYIVMEKLDRHLIDIKSDKVLSLDDQKQLIKIYKKMDEIGIFHGDANPLNYMFKNKKLYVIDFGMSKKIDNKLVKKMGTKTPNLDIMTTGMVIKLIKMDYSISSYSYLINFIPKDIREKIQA